MGRSREGSELVSAYDGGSLLFRNRIINGNMRIDQRNAGASVTPTNSQYLVDRWQASLTQASKYTAQQNAGSAALPAGFKNYLGFTSSSAYSVLTGDIFGFGQLIEGYNVADLAWGTADAKPIAISFWVQSSLTGTFGGAVKNNGDTRNYPFSYTINAANTWEQKTVYVPGDTTGSWGNWTTDVGINIRFSLGCGATYSGTAGAWTATNVWQPTGSVSVVGTNGATLRITGVQLEVGNVSTPFERRPYGTELALCQRYYYRSIPTNPNPFGSASLDLTTRALVLTKFPVPMRTNPSALEQNGTANNYDVYTTGGLTCTSVPTFSNASAEHAVSFFTFSGGTAGHSGIARSANAAAYLGWSAEL